MATKGVIFDFDGTILDSGKDGVERLLNVAQSLGLDCSQERHAFIRSLWGKTGYDLIEQCWPSVDPMIVLDTWEKFDYETPYPLFPGAKESIEVLGRVNTLSILTSRRESTHAQLAFNELRNSFTFVHTLQECPQPKPHPASIEPLLKRYEALGVRKESLVYVGDSVHADWQLAREVGIQFLAVSWGQSAPEEFLASGVQPGQIVSTFSQLSKKLI